MSEKEPFNIIIACAQCKSPVIKFLEKLVQAWPKNRIIIINKTECCECARRGESIFILENVSLYEIKDRIPENILICSYCFSDSFVDKEVYEENITTDVSLKILTITCQKCGRKSKIINLSGNDRNKVRMVWKEIREQFY